MDAPWWTRPGLEARDGRLLVAGRDAEAVAREQGTPVFAYDLPRIEEQARRLIEAFEGASVPFRLRLALKAQRDPEVLAFVRGLGSIGIDACSPREVHHALEHGWSVEEISFTGTNLSAADVDALVETGVHVNLDLLSQLERWGRRAPGTRVGVRVNPRVGASWSGLPGTEGESLYARATATKFGILPEQLDDAMVLAAEHELAIDTVHAHVGDGFLTDGLSRFEVAIERVAEMTRRVLDAGHEVREVNAGGGLGVPQRPEDEPLDADAYAVLLAKHLGPLGVTIACEPGDYLAKESGVLLGEVVTLDERDDVWFAGVDVGFNVAPERFIYGALVPTVLCRAADAEPTRTYTVAGNINEGNDLWGEDVPLPELAEGDVLALLLVGAYGRSMHIEHCLRPPACTVSFTERI
ncbi:MAG TPA: diaminopimelate decarboxylase [Actinomycetota bacterium]|nr:diaminopimelate decarboxylase [Actinomycetota bacterium]